MYFQDTIAAISSGILESALGIIRLSGKDALQIAKKILNLKENEIPEPNRVYHSWLSDPTSGEKLDEVLWFYQKAPQSYTGEDLVEITCHGGVFLMERILGVILDAGARLAEPGEFTKRAFLNGKMDLTKAEAVVDLIKSRTEAGRKQAIAHLSGQLYQRINEINQLLKDALVLLETSLNFPEDEPGYISMEEIKEKTLSAKHKIESLLENARAKKPLLEGFKVPIVGAPNVGKSTLLNALLGYERVIVSPLAGTTRDYVEESIRIEGQCFRLIDTAGIGEKCDEIQVESQRRSEILIENADLILFMLDCSRKITEQDRKIASLCFNRPVILIWNKIDLQPAIEGKEVESFIQPLGQAKISAKTGEGINQLLKLLVKVGRQLYSFDSEDLLIYDQRHINALKNANEALERALNSMNEGLSEEFMALDIRKAINFLGEITGEITTEEILNEIFSRFCIGK